MVEVLDGLRMIAGVPNIWYSPSKECKCQCFNDILGPFPKCLFCTLSTWCI